MKSTPLTAIHESLGARMMEFAGYNMPVSYSSIQEEHLTVRNSVGIFDVSHMGEFIISGTGAFDLVQHITSNDIAKLSDGIAQYTCMPNAEGGIIDDLIVYYLAEDRYLLVVNASNIKKDWDWIESMNTYGAEMKDISDDTALLAIQGPKAVTVLQKLTEVSLANIPSYHFTQGAIAGVDDVIISSTGYTGSGGFELYLPKDKATTVWAKIFEAGEHFGIKPIGLGARDTLRLEMGYCLYGNDIDDTTSPLEAGLGWITKFVDGNDFVNREALSAQKEAGLKRKLVGFEMSERGIPRHGYPIVNEAGKEVGVVTSGTQAPSLKKPVGMGYVLTELSSPDTTIYIQIRNKRIPAKVVKRPFYKPH